MNGQIPKEIQALLYSFRSAQNFNSDAVNLVPSENRMSPFARIPLASDFSNRYFFNDQLDSEFWQFRGAQEIGHLETGLTKAVLRKLGCASYVNVRPISGLSAMMIAIAGLGGDCGGIVISCDPHCGGHYATQSLVRRFGLMTRTVTAVHGAIDLDSLEKELLAGPVRLVYVDIQNALVPPDVSGIADVIRRVSPDTRLHVDASHVLGLILGGIIANPLDQGADSFGGSTHKSFPGPQKGVLFTRMPDVSERFLESQFFLVSSHHFASTLALGFAAKEYQYFGRDYALQVVENARELSKVLLAKGFDVLGGETSTHQVWVRIGDSTKTNEFSKRLYSGGIRANVQVDLPGISGPVFRLGVNELTFEGARKDAIHAVAGGMADIRDGRVPEPGEFQLRIREQMGPPFFFEL